MKAKPTINVQKTIQKMENPGVPTQYIVVESLFLENGQIAIQDVQAWVSLR